MAKCSHTTLNGPNPIPNEINENRIIQPTWILGDKSRKVLSLPLENLRTPTFVELSTFLFRLGFQNTQLITFFFFNLLYLYYLSHNEIP